MGTLYEKQALVSGGSRGIGRSIVLRLAAEGAGVAFSFKRDEDAANEVVRVVESEGGRAFAIRADQGRSEDLENLFDEAERRLGPLDILVNNAGVYHPGEILETIAEDYDHVMSVNARGTFFAMQRAGQTLRDEGRIVNISTIQTAIPEPGAAVYAASKAAVDQFTAVAAREFGGRGITVNSVSPGIVDTRLFSESYSPEARDQTVEMTALGRLGKPSDIASVVAFLTGPDARWITGENLRATGGFLV